MVKVDKRYFRPKEVETLLGDSSKARDLLGWTPRCTLEELINEMVENDLNNSRKEAKIQG